MGANWQCKPHVLSLVVKQQVEVEKNIEALQHIYRIA